MKIMGFVPARSGSKGIPKKNIYPLNDKPLIAYTIEEALKSRINRLIVSTDSLEIAEEAKRYGAEVPLMRPLELAQDNSIIEDALIDVIEKLIKSEKYKPDVIVILQPTSPLRTYRHINESIEILFEKQADSVVSASQPMEHPSDMVYWEGKGKMCFLLDTNDRYKKIQRQMYPEYLFINGAIYVFTYKSLMLNKSKFGKKIVPYIMNSVYSVDIDSIDDLFIAESVMLRKGCIDECLKRYQQNP